MSASSGQQQPQPQQAPAQGWRSRQPGGQGGAADPGAGVLASRVENVMSAVQRAADAIRADAEEHARHKLREADQQAAERLRQAEESAASVAAERIRQVTSLTDELIAQANALRSLSDQVGAELEHALSGTPPTPAPQDGDESAPSAPPAPVAAAAAAAAPEQAPPPASGSGIPPEVVLRATQLAISGESREAIGAQIAAEFSIDPEPVLREVLG